MLYNRHHAIHTPSTLLVPYCKHHVPQYHAWMQDEDLRRLTASDLLTLEEEHANQISWRDDAEKLTFISVDASSFNSRVSNRSRNGEGAVFAGVDDLPTSMLGDVNLFLHEDEDDSREGQSMHAPLVGEINLMIASPHARRKGKGRVVLGAFLWYILQNSAGIVSGYSEKSFGGQQPSDSNELDTKYVLKALVAKIDKENRASIRLFERFAFQRTRPEPNYFGEVELRLELEGAEQVVGRLLAEEGVAVEVLRYEVDAGTESQQV